MLEVSLRSQELFYGAVEMVQWFIALVALTEDLILLPSTHTVIQPIYGSSSRGYDACGA